jgi:hypothetical protein
MNITLKSRVRVGGLRPPLPPWVFCKNIYLRGFILVGECVVMIENILVIALLIGS